MIVEPGFADRDAFGMRGEGTDRINVEGGFLRCLMRMRSDREINRRKSFSERDKPIAAGDARRNGDLPFDSCGQRSRDDPVELFGKVRKIEMTMAIDYSQEAAASVSTKRGKIGEGAGRGAPGVSR